MGRTTSLIAAALVSALALSGCSGDAEPAPAPRTSSAPTSPTASPSPTPPVMPEAAKAHTEAGAKAFVEYFWEVVNYAQASLDAEVLRPLVSPDCVPCTGGISFIRGVRRRGGEIRGGPSSVAHASAVIETAGDVEIAYVTMRLTNGEQTVTDAGGAITKTYPASSLRTRFSLGAKPEGWWVIDWETLK